MTCEIQILFKDSKNDSVVLRDKDLIQRIPVLARAIEAEDPGWMTKDIRVSEPIDVPFPRKAGEFLFENLRKYISPKESKNEVLLDNYPEANAKDLAELKPILELSDFFECIPFMNCIAFVIARKLDTKSIEETAAYCGIELEPEAEVVAREGGWAYPPADIFRNLH